MVRQEISQPTGGMGVYEECQETPYFLVVWKVKLRKERTAFRLARTVTHCFSNLAIFWTSTPKISQIGEWLGIS